MLASLVSKYCHKGVLIDTNLLVGYIVGSLGTKHLVNCRATKTFTPDDFLLLGNFIKGFKKLVTTPNILTEVSNLGGKLPSSLHEEFRAAFGLIVDSLTEKYEPSKRIASHTDFPRFGLADTALIMIAPGNHLVLTDELPLFGLLQKRGVDVINFNHLRTYSWS